MFGVLPAWGFYLRHVRGVALRGVELSALAADARPPVVRDDVTGLRAEGVIAASGAGALPQPVQL